MRRHRFIRPDYQGARVRPEQEKPMPPVASILMCAPEYFDVAYVINPWMTDNVRKIDPLLAMRQWRALYDRIARHAEVRLVRPEPSSPDMVFTANAGLVCGRCVILARFRHEERQTEEPYFAEWFLEKGYAVHRGGPDLYFEGAGDALFDRGKPVLWMGYGHRSVAGARAYIEDVLAAAGHAVEIVTLELVDARYYHLDTCFCPLSGGYLLYHPAAFSATSLLAIEARVPAAKRIVCASADAQAFACNAVNIGQVIILNRASDDLVTTLAARGFVVEQCDLSEFMKAGGAAKCLTLALD